MLLFAQSELFIAFAFASRHYALNGAIC